MGNRRRSAAKASCARVAAFSLTSNRSRACCHSARETIGGRLVNFSVLVLMIDQRTRRNQKDTDRHRVGSQRSAIYSVQRAIAKPARLILTERSYCNRLLSVRMRQLPMF